MMHEILCQDGLKIGLYEVDHHALISVSWDDDPSHRIVGPADQGTLFDVLNGITYEVLADPWTCRIAKEDSDVRLTVESDGFRLVDCAFDKTDYERAILSAFHNLPQTHVA